MSGFADFFKDLAIALVPQHESNEPLHTYRWRQTAAVTIMAIGATTAFHIAWACGYLGFFGMTGFAQAIDLKTTQDTVASIRVSQIDNAVKAAVTTNCLAQREGNALALQYSSKDLSDRLREYVELTRREYPHVPGCAEVIANFTEGKPSTVLPR